MKLQFQTLVKVIDMDTQTDVVKALELSNICLQAGFQLRKTLSDNLIGMSYAENTDIAFSQYKRLSNLIKSGGLDVNEITAEYEPDFVVSLTTTDTDNWMQLVKSTTDILLSDH